MSSFVAFARAHGLNIDPGKLYASERIKRCPTLEHPKGANGAYFWDGSRGWVWAWDGKKRVLWFEDPNAKPWTDAEKQEWARKRQAAAAQHERRQHEAARRAQELMRSSVPATHDYLTMKGFPATQGLVTPDGALLVPMRNVTTNNVQGAQLIRWLPDERKYEKKMLPGMKAKGAVLRLGKAARETVLVEGFATGLSVEAAARSVGLGAAVLVTFSDRNLVHVAPSVRGRAFVYADNDKSGAGERAAKETGLPYCMSDVEGNDANDDHQAFGLMAVCRKLMEVRRAP